MRRRLPGGWLLLFWCLLLARTAAAANPAPADLDRVLAGLARSAAGIETLSSDFVQEKYLAVFQDALVSRGRFYYRKPDKLRWELRSPLVSGFALDGNRGRRWRGAEEKSESFDIRQDPVMKVVAEQLLAWARPDFPWLQGPLPDQPGGDGAGPPAPRPELRHRRPDRSPADRLRCRRQPCAAGRTA